MSTGLVTFHGPMVAKDWAHEDGVDLALVAGRSVGRCGLVGCASRRGCQRAGRWRSRRSSIRRMPLDSGRIARHALRNQDGRHDSLSRRYRRQALSDRPHADAIEAGRASRRCARHRLRRNARLRPDREIRVTLCRKSSRESSAICGVPVAFGVTSGHVTSGNITLPFGVQAKLDSAKRSGQL